MIRLTKIIIPVALVFLITACKSAPKPTSRYVQIMDKFEEWKSIQYEHKNYEIASRCNGDTVSQEGYKGPEIGIPDDIDVTFTDINRDDKPDALITFFITQCDGGNALMFAQKSILIISDKTGYKTDDSYIDKVEKLFKKGWIIMEGATEGSLDGRYFDYKEGDGRCCPGIEKPFSIDYKTGKLEFDQ